MQYKLKPVSMKSEDYEAELIQFGGSEDFRHQSKNHDMKLFFMNGSTN
jgi:hypothetical protein